MKILLYFLLLVFSNTTLNAQNQPSQEYRTVDGSSYTQSKNVYLLTLFQSLPEVREILEADPGLVKIADHKAELLNRSFENCGDDAFCYPESIPFSLEEVDDVAERLQVLAQSNPALKSLVTDHLIPSGKYQMQNASLPEVWLAEAWKHDAKTINHMIGVY